MKTLCPNGNTNCPCRNEVCRNCTRDLSAFQKTLAVIIVSLLLVAAMAAGGCANKYKSCPAYGSAKVKTANV